MSLSRDDGIVPDTPSHELDELEGSSLNTDADEDEIHAEEVASWKKRPWWKRPSPYWIAFGMLISAMGYSATFAPRVEVYTLLVCRTLKAEYFPDSPIYTIAPRIVGAAPTSDTDANVPSYLSALNITYPSTIPGYEEDKQTRQRCISDPEVQATVAKLSATLTTTMGILSCLATGWWANFCDRHGRRPVLAASIIGLLVVDLTFLVTANFVDYLPGGYWFLLTGFIIEGLLGSMPTGVAANHAYIADTCEPSARSQIFAVTLGLMFIGFAAGPLLGGFLIHFTGSTLSAFFMAASCHFFYTLLLIFVLPESLTEAKARAARLRYKQEKEQNMNVSTLRRIFKEATRFLSALAVVLPRDVVDANPLKTVEEGLEFVPSGHVLWGSMPFLIQYAIAAFRWSSETANYYFSSIGITRAFVLTVLLPLMIKFLKSRAAPTSHTPFSGDVTPEATLLHQSPSPLRSRSRSHQRSTHRPPSRSLADQRPNHSVNVDIFLARCAVGLEIVACWVMAAATSGTVFAAGTVVGAMSVAFSPTIQALALEVYHSERNNGTAARGGQGGTGKLFGALSVLQALGSQIIAPAVYGFIYSRTVATFPQAIMLVTASCFAVALVLLAFVRVPASAQGPLDAEELDGGEEGRNENSVEGVLVDVEVETRE
ncbi:hypothetical protein F5J12DRAFT_892867 [Pisolithus orientalis]|uniref:uncharacterized protein n=1 Tax=Pisolithus orientalis TaxID=936130 RepID=UPI0022241AD7|nr:uncharacterized protein F5J12DRAFT_892867 [Pisolithus orientalis]KAI6006691.1 hypothetical protein F5J12DRAFT_892867 [Pisolithus orientalis]